MVITGALVVLTPYRRRHVPTYHGWMGDPALLAATASERLTLAEEYENCASWVKDRHKLSFIVLVRPRRTGGGDNRMGPRKVPAPRATSAASASAGSTTSAVDGNDFEAGQKEEEYDEDGLSAMAGDVNLFFDRHMPGAAEVEVMVAGRPHRRRGIATEALRLLLWYGATHCGVTRFFAKIGEANAASLALFEEKLGFRRINYAACFREHELELFCGSGDIGVSIGDIIKEEKSGYVSGEATFTPLPQPTILVDIAPYAEMVEAVKQENKNKKQQLQEFTDATSPTATSAR